nr:autotransporter outer membrane beta-barrel domain-containing protein [Bradyrhizobium sp. dw_78]
MILNASTSNPDGEIDGQVNNFEIINKVGNGAWLITGDIINTGGAVAVDVQDGRLILTSNNQSFNGTMTVDPAGTLQLGNGGTSGNLNSNILDNGTVAFDRSDAITFSNVISGSGSVEQNGTGTTTLTAVNTYSGGTFVNTGTLVVGDADHTSAALAGGGPVAVATGATLTGYGSITGNVTNNGTMGVANALPAFNSGPSGDFTINGNLTNNGMIHIGGGGNAPVNQLVVNGNYVGNNGTIYLNTFLGSDNSPSDKLVISGGTASGTTLLHITNVGGTGAATSSNGILVVSTINGATTAPNAFALEGEVRGGAFDYALQQGGNGLTRAFLQDWFLRNEFIVPGSPGPPAPPGPDFPVDPPSAVLPPGDYPIIGPELATYGVVQPMARQLGTSVLGTLHERRGDTLLDTPCAADSNDPQPRNHSETSHSGCTGNGWGSSPTWGRVLGQQIDNHYHAFADPRASGQILGFQSGIDLWRGSLLPGHQDVAGIYFSYANADADVSGLVADVTRLTYVLEHTGHLNLDAWSGGAYWTHYGPGGWYFDAVTQFTRYDSTASTQFANLDTMGNGFIGSLETGYPIALPMLGPGFVLEPQAQILWQRVQFNDGNDGLGDVALGTTDGATSRLGLRGRWTFTTDQGQQWQPYVRVNYWQDWGARETTVYSGVDTVPLLEQASRVQVGGGVTARINAGLTLYANADYQFEVGQSDGTRRNGVDATAGVSFKW